MNVRHIFPLLRLRRGDGGWWESTTYRHPTLKLVNFSLALVCNFCEKDNVVGLLQTDGRPAKTEKKL